MKKKLTNREAHKLADKLMIDMNDDGIPFYDTTFYATNDEETEIWAFDTKKERDRFVDKCNNK